MSRKLTNEEFIDISKRKHGDKYGYDQVVYINCMTKVEIFCKECNEYFLQIPMSHMKGFPCRKCADRKTGDRNRKTKEKFIIDAVSVHGGKYSYQNVSYINSGSKVSIFCNTCSDFFMQAPRDHLSGHGCHRCNDPFRWDTKEFIDQAIRKHGNRYRYDLVSYRTNKIKVEIVCNHCNRSFWQDPHTHLKGSGCPACNESKGEQMIAKILDRLKIRYTREHADYNNPTGHNFKWDFYFPYHHSIIEYHGLQHFEFSRCFHKNDQGFAKQLEKDRIRVEYARSIGCRYLMIPYTITQEDQAEQMIRDFLAL